jgi:hypothetical protein
VRLIWVLLIGTFLGIAVLIWMAVGLKILFGAA